MQVALANVLRLSKESLQAVTELGISIRNEMMAFMKEIVDVIESLKASLTAQKGSSQTNASDAALDNNEQDLPTDRGRKAGVPHSPHRSQVYTVHGETVLDNLHRETGREQDRHQYNKPAMRKQFENNMPNYVTNFIIIDNQQIVPPYYPQISLQISRFIRGPRWY